MLFTRESWVLLNDGKITRASVCVKSADRLCRGLEHRRGRVEGGEERGLLQCSGLRCLAENYLRVEIPLPPAQRAASDRDGDAESTGTMCTKRQQPSPRFSSRKRNVCSFLTQIKGCVGVKIDPWTRLFGGTEAVGSF